MARRRRRIPLALIYNLAAVCFCALVVLHQHRSFWWFLLGVAVLEVSCVVVSLVILSRWPNWPDLTPVPEGSSR